MKGETSFKKKCQKALVSIGNISVILQNIDVQDSPFNSNILIVSVDETLDENLKEFENSWQMLKINKEKLRLGGV